MNLRWVLAAFGVAVAALGLGAALVGRMLALGFDLRNEANLHTLTLEVLKSSELPYALTGLSALELWSDYAVVQRKMEKSPHFVKVLKGDLQKWKDFLNSESIPNYVEKGGTVGEFVVLIPVSRLSFVKRNGLKAERLWETVRQAEGNEAYQPLLNYIKKKHST